MRSMLLEEREFFRQIFGRVLNVRVRNTEVKLVILQRINYERFIFGREDNFLRSALRINSRRKNFRAVVDENFHA